jgi:hypothetical protein
MDSDEHSFDFQAPERKDIKPQKDHESDKKSMNNEENVRLHHI